VDSLSRQIEKANLEGKLRGFKVSKGNIITHLMFVDDLFILGPGEVDEWIHMKTLLDCFCKASGLYINFSKSVCVFSNIDETVLQAVDQVWNVVFSPLDEGIKYLGFFLKSTNYRVSDWHWFLKKFEKRVLLWANKWLSMGG